MQRVRRMRCVAKNKRLAVVGCREGNRSGDRWSRGFGGLQSSGDLGERTGIRTRASEGSPC
ncbi:MAG: hypothetical protein HOC74_00180 [Gemmatimonadetes bacterium]|nr:hypothetical protein [Gemmatimonadota bacterium]